MALSVTDGLLLNGSGLIRPVVVLDTHTVMNSPCRLVRYGHAGQLQRASQGPLPVPLLAARHVVGEVDEHLAARAADQGLDPDEVTLAWDQHLRPHIRVVDLAIRDHLDPLLRPVLRGDPDDLPTAALALLVAPAIVLTEDRVLVDNGFATRKSWLEAAGDVNTVADADAIRVSLLMTATVTTMGIGYGSAAVVRAGRRAPLCALAVVLPVLAGAYLLVRRYPVGRMLKELGREGATEWGALVERQKLAAARLPWVAVPAGRVPTLEEWCARLLARVTATLSAAELHQQLRDTAHPAPSVAQVRATLANHPAFIEVARGRWQLGVSACGQLPAPGDEHP